MEPTSQPISTYARGTWGPSSLISPALPRERLESARECRRRPCIRCRARNVRLGVPGGASIAACERERDGELFRAWFRTGGQTQKNGKTRLWACPKIRPAEGQNTKHETRKNTGMGQNRRRFHRIPHRLQLQIITHPSNLAGAESDSEVQGTEVAAGGVQLQASPNAPMGATPGGGRRLPRGATLRSSVLARCVLRRDGGADHRRPRYQSECRGGGLLR